MGNEQSVPAPRRPPNKLSKPRTNNNSSANLLNTKSAPASRRNSVAANDSPTKSRYSLLPVELPAEPVERKKEETQKKRRSLFRSKSAQPKSQIFKPELDVEKGVVEPIQVEQSHRWSRQSMPRGDSMNFEFGDEALEKPLEMRPPPPRKRTSISQPQGQHNSRLSLVAELPSPKPEQAESTKRISRYDQGDAAESSMGSRTKSDTQLYAPIRRRSLLQHGVATRTSYIEEPRQSLPPQPKTTEEFHNYYYNPAKPTSSPLSQIAALQPPPDFFPGPRVETPTELDYGHIGAKLGTLRITNGSASPTPSLEHSLRRAATMGQEEDYIMAGEARQSINRGPRHGLGQRSNTIAVPAESNKTPWIVRAESPLRQEVEEKKEGRSQPPLGETQFPRRESEESPLPPKYAFNTLTIDIPDPSFSSLALFDFGTTETLLKSTVSPIKSLELAHEYQQDLALSPFSFDNSPPASPALQVMSKHMAVEDDLFAAEPATPVLSDRFPRSFDSAYEGGPAGKTVKGPRELAPKPLAKADSGYSSNVSLRSFKKDSAATASADEAPPTPPKDNFRKASSTYSVASSRVASSNYSVRSTESEITLRAKRSLPALPMEDAVPEQPARQPPPVPLKQGQVLGSSKAAAAQPQTPDLTYPSALSAQLVVPPKEPRRKSVPTTQHTREDSPASESVSSTSSHWPAKKLNKRAQAVQPQPEPVYTVQAFRSQSEQMRIPLPPIEARRKLEERVDSFPVASIPNTYGGQLGLRHSCSKETLGTIFSVGSMEVRDELNFARLQSALPPVPTQATIPEHPTANSLRKSELSGKEKCPRPSSYDNKLPHLPAQPSRDLPTSSMSARTEFNRRNTYQAPLPSLPSQDDWTRKSMDRAARESPAPRMQTQNEFESQVTSFDSISNSLGRSPYDAALSATKPNAISNVQERAKSMTAQLEAEAAARFARQRNVSQESDATVVRSRKSFDSITNARPYVEPRTSSDRVRERTYPPQAHAKFNSSPINRRPTPSMQSSFSSTRQDSSAIDSPISEQLGAWGLNEDDETRRFSTLSSLSKKTKSPPPVSMTTQRKMVPTSTGSHAMIPPSRSPPLPAQAPNRTPPQPPGEEPAWIQQWNQPTSYWAERRKSAGEALKVQPRKSMEMRRPTESSKPDLRSRKSLDAYSYREAMRDQEAGRRQTLNTGFRSFDVTQNKGWNVGVGYENSTHNPAYEARHTPTWVDGAIRGTTSQQAYDHTYGTSNHSHSNKENFHQEEYYEPTSSDPSQQGHAAEEFHQRKTSTSDMLVLDRYAGGLDYGYETGYGLGGSAGTRNTGKMAAGSRKSGPVSKAYGLDFSDVPVIVQRVPVRG